MGSQPMTDMDVLILAPFGKDSALIADALRHSSVQARVVPNAGDLVRTIPESGAAIIAEEALSREDIKELARNLESQPPWADFPIIVLTGGGVSTAATEVAARALAPLGNVALLERPLRHATLISAVRSALAARRRQYEIRDHLQQRKQTEDALREARDSLESLVEERTATLRRLSAQLLHVQDEERRRIARELHDSLGQYLAAAKVTLDTLAFSGESDNGCLSEAVQLIDQAIRETRTLSHLLHPPLLDAAGLASAVTWYVEGFAKRSGIKADLALPENPGRLPISVETALFRIMQEALTNVHRHSGSRRVDINLSVNDATAKLVIRDFGRGIPKQVVSGFEQSGTNVGVGLAGIRERVKELGGTLHVHSGGQGTTLEACVPITDQGGGVFATTPLSQIYSSLVS